VPIVDVQDVQRSRQKVRQVASAETERAASAANFFMLVSRSASDGAPANFVRLGSARCAGYVHTAIFIDASRIGLARGTQSAVADPCDALKLLLLARCDPKTPAHFKSDMH
jgi:predicted pyridoxine 5'-phosphate oxidase superfamily flavin-nucleotide-binding protein